MFRYRYLAKLERSWATAVVQSGRASFILLFSFSFFSHPLAFDYILGVKNKGNNKLREAVKTATIDLLLN